MYLKSIRLLNDGEEYGILLYKKNIYNTLYPFKIFPEKDLTYIEFEPITIFYGGNGSGKTTILNIISDGIHASKRNVVKRSELFNDYVCRFKKSMQRINQDELKEIKYISSDDVFDYLLDQRAINSGINRRKEELINEYNNYRYSPSTNYNSSFNQYEELKNEIDSKKMSVSKYVRTRLKNNNTIQESNGETALDFWENQIEDNSLYIIDEPENSLSAENQLKLKKFIEESARFYNCQFIIATHSPFLLALEFAKVYDLDSYPVKEREWTKLENVKAYYKFFKEHEKDFEKRKIE